MGCEKGGSFVCCERQTLCAVRREIGPLCAVRIKGRLFVCCEKGNYLLREGRCFVCCEKGGSLCAVKRETDSYVL